MQEKRITAVNDTGALMLEMKEVLGADGDFMKEKLPKLLAVCTQHPESAEMLFNRVKKFLQFPNWLSCVIRAAVNIFF